MRILQFVLPFAAAFLATKLAKMAIVLGFIEGARRLFGS